MSESKYKLLQELLPWVEKYELEQGSGSGTVPDFQHWLGQRLLLEEQAHTSDAPIEVVEGEISRYLTMLNRYARFYIKKALQPTDFVSLDDFGYLMHLLDGGRTTKSALIAKNIHDIPSGTEIIKRLIREGWVTQSRDQVDKRRVYVAINEKGKGALFETLKQLRKIAGILSADLDEAEKREFLRLLKKLDAYHHTAYQQNKDKAFDEMMVKHR